MTQISIFSFSTKNFLTRALWLLGWVWLACSPLLAQTRLGLHYTQEELHVWRVRSGQPGYPGTAMYKTLGDVAQGGFAAGASGNYSPGDWDRITANANKFLNNTNNARVNDRYTNYYTGTGCVPQVGNGNNDPDERGILIRDAAFYYLVTGNTSYADVVKDELLNHITNDVNLQFNNTARWCPGVIKDVSPGFMIAYWLTRLLYTYDYVKDYANLTATEKATLNTWFRHAATYMQSNYETDLNNRFVNSPAGNYTLNTSGGVETSPGTVLYFNGPATRQTSRYYNNRRLAMLGFVGLAGVFLNDATLKSTSKRFFTEFIRYGIYSTGYFVDLLRGIEDQSVDKGYGYSINHLMIAMADAFARIGDLDLYNYQNSGGLTAAQVGKAADATSDGTLKGLKMHAKAMLDLRNRQVAIYSTDCGILYNTTANATPPASTVAYTATSATGGWTTNPTGAQTTAVRRAASSSWTTAFSVLYNTDANAKLPANTIPYNALTPTNLQNSGGIKTSSPVTYYPNWTTSPTGANQKCFRTDQDSQWVREFTSTPTEPKLIVQNGNANYRVDGVDAILGNYSVTDIVYSVANLYYRDNYILASYNRTATGSVPYPIKAQTIGSQPVWGTVGQYPAVLFMFGQMENNPANPFLPPTVNLTYPGNNATFSAPASITLTANAAATSTNGVIQKVEFYDGTSKLGEDLTSPYSYIWNSPSLGAHTITAKAISKLGISTTSSTATLTVGPALALLEAETIYTKVTDTDNDVNQITCTGTLSNAKGVQLTDAGDAIRLTFNITQTGLYRLGVNGRSGYSGSPTAYWPNGHSFTVNGSAKTFTGDASTVSSSLSTCMGNSYWGTMYSGNLQLNAGSNNIVVTSNGGYRGIDYIIVEFVTNGSGARLAYESEANETLPTLVAFPNPFQDQITVDLGEPATGTYQISLTDALGRSYYAREHQLKDHQTQVVIPLSGKSLSPGLYLLQLNNGGKSLPKVLKLIKRE